MQPSPFRIDLGDGLDLVLRERWTVEPLNALIVKNLERLRRWEPWAQPEPNEDALWSFTRSQLLEWVEGRSIPCAIRADGSLVGTAGARIDPYTGTADVGYWVDVDHEGRGVVSRAVSALVDRLFADDGVARVEIRTATQNVRSRAVAERLGFTHEGTLRAAFRVGDVRHDLAVYGLLRS
jgi:ribosomal-protein-serine acetyltransferase